MDCYFDNSATTRVSDRVFQVVKKTMRAGVKYNEKTQEQRCRQSSLQYVGNFMQDLISKAGVVDNRYLFF